jgi:hypothetical protein
MFVYIPSMYRSASVYALVHLCVCVCVCVYIYIYIIALMMEAARTS